MPMTAGQRSSLRPFTLIELMTVIAIIAILAGLVAGISSFAFSKARESKTQAIIKQISIALESYKQKYGYFPNYEYKSEPKGDPSKFFLDYIPETGAPSDGEKVSNNLNQFLNYENLRKNGRLDDPSKDFDDKNFYTVLDGYNRPLIYRCPGHFNRNSYDLGSVGPDGMWGSSANRAFDEEDNESPHTLKLGSSNSYYDDNFGKPQTDDLTNFSRK